MHTVHQTYTIHVKPHYTDHHSPNTYILCITLYYIDGINMSNQDIFDYKLILTVGITEDIRLDLEGNIVINGYVYDSAKQRDVKIEIILELPDDKEYRQKILETLKKVIENGLQA